ncbi:MAG: OmpA family protein [Deltaproteobacteria bacterium]|nr:OmpA family protein [Deltaproteobacteria bacterium]
MTMIFFFFSDRILPRSYELLDKVAEVIGEHQEIPLIRVEGHTDSTGRDRYNKKLSDRRAKSVRRYLVAAGVGAARLIAIGYGEERPIDSNKTKAGQANNRRVEFTILNSEDSEDSDSDEDAP